MYLNKIKEKLELDDTYIISVLVSRAALGPYSDTYILTKGFYSIIIEQVTWAKLKLLIIDGIELEDYLLEPTKSAVLFLEKYF